MKIKTVQVNAIWPRRSGNRYGNYWGFYTYKTVTDDNGFTRYYLNDEPISKEDGNAFYKKVKEGNAEFQKSKEAVRFCKENRIKISDTYKEVHSYRELTVDELIKEYKAAINPWTCMIDDYDTEKREEAKNRELQRRIDELEELK